MDNLSIQSIVHQKIPQNLEVENPNTSTTKSFFYRAYSAWNKLTYEIRKIELPIRFKKKLTFLEGGFLLAMLSSNLIEELDE